MANHTVTLYVDTVNVTQATVDTYCNFGQGEGTSNEDYTVTVNAGDTITWVGAALNGSTNTVSIKQINYEGNSNVFQDNNLLGSGDPKTVVGTVLSTASGLGETYKIFFNVSNKNGQFNIDPKIQVNR